MSDTTSAIFKNFITPVTSLSIPEGDSIFIGQKIERVIGHTAEGDINLYNGLTAGLKVEPSIFNKEGVQACKIFYKSGTTHGGYETIESESSIKVIKEEPIKLILKKRPYKTSLRVLDDLDICGAEFRVILNSGRSFDTDFRFVKASLEDNGVTYTYSYNGVEISTTSEITVLPIQAIKASLTIPKSSLDEGDVVDASCFRVEALFGDYTSKRLTDFTIEPTKMGVGTDKIAISYEGFTTYVEIDPIEDTSPDNAISISIATEPTKKEYEDRETFDPTGLTFKVTKRKGSEEIISVEDSRISYTDPGILKVTTPITFTYKDVYSTLTCSYNVVVKDSSNVETITTTINEEGSTVLTSENSMASVELTAGSVEGTQATVEIYTKAADLDKAPATGYSEVDIVSLNLNVDGKEVTEFTEPVKVTVNTLKGLTKENFVVSSGTDKCTITEYDSSTGKLTFETSHFSVFCVHADLKDISVLNISTRTGYSSLTTSVGNLKTEGNLKLLKDIDEGTILVENGETFTLNMNNHKIVAPSVVIKLLHGNVTVTGRGTLSETEEYGFGAIYILGSPTEDVANYSVIKIGRDITLKGWAGIFIDYIDETKYCGYGIVIDSAANIQCPLEGETNSNGYGVYLNGTSTKTEGNIPKITLGGNITVNNEVTSQNDGNGVYAAGYANFTLDNTTISAPESAIEIRAGKMNIAGGKYTSTAKDYSVKANGSGTTTVGAALAVAQHTTKLPIDFTIEEATVLGPVGLAVNNPQKNSIEDCKKVNVSGKNITVKATSEYSIDDSFIIEGDSTSFEVKAKEVIEEEA